MPAMKVPVAVEAFPIRICGYSTATVDKILGRNFVLFDIERVLKRIRLGPVNTEPCKHLFPRIQMSNIEI